MILISLASLTLFNVCLNATTSSSISFDDLKARRISFFRDLQPIPQDDNKPLNATSNQPLASKSPNELQEDSNLIADLFQRHNKDTRIETIDAHLPRLLQDLNVFALQTNDEGSRNMSIFSKINRSATAIGDAELAHMLANPVASEAILQRRQNIVKFLLKDTAATKCDEILTTFKKNEVDTLHLFREIAGFDYQNEKGEKLNYAAEDLFFKGRLNRLNRSEIALLLGTIVDAKLAFPLKFISMGITATVIGIGTAVGGTYNTRDTSRAIAGGTGMTLIGLYYLNDIHTKKLPMIHHMRHQLQGITELIKAYNECKKLAHDCHEMRSLLDEAQRNHKENPEFEALSTMLTSNTFQGEDSRYFHYGRVLAAYHIAKNHQEKIIDMLRCVAMVDTHRSIAKLYQEHASSKNKYAFAEFIASKDALIHAEEFWNPLLNASTAVPNTITLSSNENEGPQVAVVTGANSGGKSTITVNGVGSLNLLASTLGIVPATTYKTTLFDSMITSIKIQDNLKTGESHFVAEANVAAKMVKKAQDVSLEGKKVLVLIDELFEGTDSKTARASSRKVLNRILPYPNIICVNATQHKELTGPAGLEEEHPKKCHNFKVNVALDPNTQKISHLYKIERGISDQRIGSQLVEEAFKREGVR